MSESENPDPLEDRVVKPRKLWLVIGILFLLVVLFFFLTVEPELLEPGSALTFGWLRFLRRTVPRIFWNWDLVGMALLCLALVLFLAHRFLTWLSGSIANARNLSWQWPWKWTWCGISVVLVFFLVGMSIGGAVHQIGWVLSSPDPWFEAKGRSIFDFNDMRQIEAAFEIAKEDTKGDLVALRQKMWSSEYGLPFPTEGGAPLVEKYRVLFVLQEDGRVSGVIIFPREPQRLARTGAIYSVIGAPDRVTPEKVEELIRTNQQHLSSL